MGWLVVYMHFEDFRNSPTVSAPVLAHDPGFLQTPG